MAAGVPSIGRPTVIEIARFRQDAGRLDGLERTMMMSAEADGMDVREGSWFITAWTDFLSQWERPYPDLNRTLPTQSYDVLGGSPSRMGSVATKSKYD
jgi:hypothetical protein